MGRGGKRKKKKRAGGRKRGACPHTHRQPLVRAVVALWKLGRQGLRHEDIERQAVLVPFACGPPKMQASDWLVGRLLDAQVASSGQKGGGRAECDDRRRTIVLKAARAPIDGLDHFLRRPLWAAGGWGRLPPVGGRQGVSVSNAEEERDGLCCGL